MFSKTRKISVAHSPDADDAFMFYALATGKVRSDLVEFEHILGDIQTLNEAAAESRYDMTAISFHAYPYVADRYILTTSGSSVGDGYGPIVVSKCSMSPSELRGKSIGVPGVTTTAYLALRLFEPNFEAQVIHFDAILDAVENEVVEAGVIIHEGQLSYNHTGLQRVMDLGEWWGQKHNLPLPLGANAVLRSLSPELQRECDRCLGESIRYGLDHREEALAYAQEFARGVNQNLTDKFVGMYVNKHTVGMHPEVAESAQKLLDLGHETGCIPHRVQVEYL